MSKVILRRLGRFIVGLSKEHLALALAAIVSLSYGAMYLMYFRFYVGFGLHPSDVGTTRLRLLQESIFGPILVVVWRFRELWWVVLLIIVAATAIGESSARGRANDVEGGESRRWTDRAAVVGCALLALSAVFLVSGYVQLMREAPRVSTDIRREGHIYVAYVKRPGDWPGLDIQAIPADINNADGDPLPGLTQGCVLYLGEANGTVVVLDVRKDTVSRIPSASVVISLHIDFNDYDNERLPAVCIVDDGNDVHPVGSP